MRVSLSFRDIDTFSESICVLTSPKSSPNLSTLHHIISHYRVFNLDSSRYNQQLRNLNQNPRQGKKNTDCGPRTFCTHSDTSPHLPSPPVPNKNRRSKPSELARAPAPSTTLYWQARRGPLGAEARRPPGVARSDE